MAKPEAPDRPRPKVRFGRILLTLLTLAVLGAVAYGASWLNARTYYLVVSATEARVERGRMFPVGHQPYFPDDPLLRRAYALITLPGGLRTPQGETRFEERAALDDALRRLLKEALAQVLAQPTEQTPTLAAEYLTQLEALPGASLTEERALEDLRRQARQAEAQLLLGRAKANLEQAAKLLKSASDDPDAQRRAQTVDSVLGALGRISVAKPEGRPARPVPTSTIGTATVAP